VGSFGRAAPSSSDGLSPTLGGGETEEIELMGDEERGRGLPASCATLRTYARETVSLLRFRPKVVKSMESMTWLGKAG
jgi:hypothetical protein